MRGARQFEQLCASLSTMPTLKERVDAFGAVIKRRREALGLTQAGLAENAGLHKNFVYLIEKGLTAAAIDSVYLLADALHVSGSTLLREAERLLRDDS